MTQQIADGVVVIIGTGGMGEAVARRLGPGRHLVLADLSPENLDRRAARFREDGYDAETVHLDVSDAAAVTKLASHAASLGPLRSIFHSAGVSPAQASAEQIFRVDVMGTAFVLDAFEPHVGPGAVAVCVASMAGTMTELSSEVVRAIAVTPTEQLAALEVFDPSVDPGTAYGVSKRANQIRVQGAAVRWGRRGARVVSISPGIISTRDGRMELASENGEVMRMMIDMSAMQRLGTADDIAAVVEFLVSPAASFITGTDILVDGGVIASLTIAE